MRLFDRKAGNCSKSHIKLVETSWWKKLWNLILDGSKKKKLPGFY